MRVMNTCYISMFGQIGNMSLSEPWLRSKVESKTLIRQSDPSIQVPVHHLALG